MNSDHSRFKKIIRGQLRKDLKHLISSGQIVTRFLENEKKGSGDQKSITIDLPGIELPRFTFGSNDDQQNSSENGVGQGKGQIGDEIDGQKQSAGPQASDQPDELSFGDEVSLDELADMLGEELQLPRIEKKGKEQISKNSAKYSGILTQGSESLRNFKHTYRQALKRSLSLDIYDHKNPCVVPIKDDKRYRGYSLENKPTFAACVLYIMDISGSMGQEQKQMVRLTSFWLDTWLARHYKGLQKRFIVHDAKAHEVTEKQFYSVEESGGTLISSAYLKALSLIDREFNPQDWNIYIFHFSDGDNWSGNDTAKCMEILKNHLLPKINLFCYGQTQSRYGSGQFYNDLKNSIQPNNPKVIIDRIKNKNEIISTLKTFLSTGR